MNQRKKMEIQCVIYQVKSLNCSSIYIGEIGRKLKSRQDENKQNAKKNDESKISGLLSLIKITGDVID